MTILVPYGERPESRLALEHAVEEAHRREAPLHLVRIMREPATSKEAQVDAWQASVHRER